MILHAGILDRYRNPLYMVKSLSELDMDYQLVVTADGKLADRMTKLARQEDVPLIHKGWVSKRQLMDLYSKASVLVNCNRRETFGITLLEAMASGVPVVTPDEGAPPEFIEDGVTGFLYDFDRPGDFVNKVEKAISRPDVGERARDFVLKNYTDKQILPMIEKRYKDLLVDR